MKIARDDYITTENYVPEMVTETHEEICIQTLKHIVQKKDMDASL